LIMEPTLRIGIKRNAKAFVEKVARQDHILPHQVVRQALDTYRVLRAVKRHDGEVILRRANGTFEHAFSEGHSKA
jgi:hypothetical protein